MVESTLCDSDERFLDQPKWFDEVSVGDRWRSPSRTITEADVVNFAGLTGDFNPLHVDHHYARNSPYGRPIVHGFLGVSLVAGLGSHSPLMRTAALLRVTDWRFLNPVFIGDTVHVETTLQEMQPHGRRHGLVIWLRQLVNSETNVIAQQGIFETLVRQRPARTVSGAQSAG